MRQIPQALRRLRNKRPRGVTLRLVGARTQKDSPGVSSRVSSNVSGGRHRRAEVHLGDLPYRSGPAPFSAVIVRIRPLACPWHNCAEMELVRAFVSFSSSDIGHYHLMCAVSSARRSAARR